jgi:cleavage and polyadenylation specificity factor subunit 1
MERSHWTLKAAIMCHADQQWTEGPPLVLLGIRTSFKADMQASVAELVYGEPLKIPGKLRTPTADPVEPAHLITQLRRHMARLRPVPASHHASSSTFLHKDLHNCTHVFLRQDATRRDLELPYSDPYQVLWRREKTLQPFVRGKPVTVSADRVKPAYVLNEADCGSTIFNPLASATPDIAPPPATQTARSGRRIRFPARFNT